MTKKTEMESFTGEYAMSGSDNALSRKHMNASIIAQDDAMANENQYRKALDESVKREKK